MKTSPAVAVQHGLRRALPARPALAGQRSSVIVRFQENKRPASAADVDSMDEKLHTGKPTDTKLSPEEIDSVSNSSHSPRGWACPSSFEHFWGCGWELTKLLSQLHHTNPGTHNMLKRIIVLLAQPCSCATRSPARRSIGLPPRCLQRQLRCVPTWAMLLTSGRCRPSTVLALRPSTAACQW